MLYLLEQPHTLGNARCEPVNANYHMYHVSYSHLSKFGSKYCAFQMGIRRNTIWETLGINVTKTESSQAQTGYRPYLPHPRITGVEEGVITSGVVGGTSGSADRRTEQKFEQAGGDASTILQERHRGSGWGGQEGGQGGGTIRWNITSGPVVHTSYKNVTRYLGPHGEVLYEETVTSRPPDAVQTANRFGAEGEVHSVQQAGRGFGQENRPGFDGKSTDTV